MSACDPAAFESQLQAPVPELNEGPVLAEPDPKAGAVGDPFMGVHRLETQRIREYTSEASEDDGPAKPDRLTRHSPVAKPMSDRRMKVRRTP